MKCSESWLREWVNPNITHNQLSSILTMAGLEVEEIKPVAKDFNGVVIGKVLTVKKHEEAQRLHICEVSISEKDKLQIVCGAENVRPGLKVAVALIGAVLPNDITIKKTSIRNIESYGMLCSASELSLSESSQGILELPQDSPLGQDLRQYLILSDHTIDISITPNRGDCLSIKGLAREIASLTSSPLLINTDTYEVKTTSNETQVVNVKDKINCPAYFGRVIRGVNAYAETPVWLKERLQRSGLRSISSIVDVTNYVMLELGQPMHAFDLDTIQDEIQIRKSLKGEKIALLDDSIKELDAETLIIADKNKPLAIAGVMGGLDSSVTTQTENIFLESAFFNPEIVARQRQFYNLNSESSYRFERGVDPSIQKQALERATQLILEINGGLAGVIIEAVDADSLPKTKNVFLSQEKITKVLGIVISNLEVEKIFHALAFQFKKADAGWFVTIPNYRFDIALPEDLIEEIARLYGYDNIPIHTLKANLQASGINEEEQDFSSIRNQLSSDSYHEIISYSFISKTLQQLLDPQKTPCELVNPITNDMAVMRTNLWPGLVNAMLYNKSRQQHRIRLFEIGACFIKQDTQFAQQMKIAGLITGSVTQEQWGQAARIVDFYDIKGDVQRLLAFLNQDLLMFIPEKHDSLHPGQSAGIYYKDQKIGILGALHPQVLANLDIDDKVFVFEIDIDCLKDKKIPMIQDVSKFPEIRRDLAILVNQAIPARDIQDTIKLIAGDWLKDVFIFDVYQGKGITPGLKSIALGLVLQHPSRTLVDDEITALVERIVSTLKGKLGAELRR